MADDLEAVLEPLRSREQELDDLVARARRGAEETLAAARREAEQLGERARRELEADLAAARAGLARELEAFAETRRRQRQERVARLRRTARAGWDQAVALCLACTTGAGD